MKLKSTGSSAVEGIYCSMCIFCSREYTARGSSAVEGIHSSVCVHISDLDPRASAVDGICCSMYVPIRDPLPTDPSSLPGTESNPTAVLNNADPSSVPGTERNPTALSNNVSWGDLQNELEGNWNYICPYMGYTFSTEDANKIVRLYEDLTQSSFVTVKQDKEYSSLGLSCDQTSYIWFEDRKGCTTSYVLGYDGVPYIFLGKRIMACHYGPDKHHCDKQKTADAKQSKKGDHIYTSKKSRKLVQNTIKKNCQCKIVIKAVVKFPQFKIETNTKSNRAACSEKVKEAIAAGNQGERRLYIKLPEPSQHDAFHYTGEVAAFLNPIAPEVREKIRSLVGEGVRRISEMRRHVNTFVSKELFQDKSLPKQTDRKYFPSNNDLRNHIYQAQIRHRYSKIDQINLEAKISQWKRQSQEDSFHYRACKLEEPTAHVPDDGNDEVLPIISQPLPQSLLFCHQTTWQKRILQRYGNEMCFLDATYRTTRYALPLFFLVVKTNMGYIVVGSFVVQHETKAAISEALQQFQTWNTDWNPEYFLTDCSEPEITAIEETFPGNVTNICRKCSCGYRQDEDWIQCNSCNWWHHFHCTEVSRTVSNAGHASFIFLCNTCQGLDSLAPADTWEALSGLPNISPVKRRCLNAFDDSFPTTSSKFPITSTPLHPTTSSKGCTPTGPSTSSKHSNTTAHASDMTAQPSTSDPPSLIEPFVICHLNNQIKICAGCRYKFQKPVKEPDDFVIRHRELDSFFDKRLGSMRSVFQNKYYHISANCIKSKHPTFMKTSLCIPPGIKLSEQHLIYFKSFGVDLSRFVNRKL